MIRLGDSHLEQLHNFPMSSIKSSWASTMKQPHGQGRSETLSTLEGG